MNRQALWTAIPRKCCCPPCKSIHEQLHTTILMVTHDAFTASYADRILFLQDGKFLRSCIRERTAEPIFSQNTGTSLPSWEEGKAMYIKLIFKNAKRSARDYLVYIVTLTICATLFYSFLSVSSRYYKPDIGSDYKFTLLGDSMKLAICTVTLILLF